MGQFTTCGRNAAAIAAALASALAACFAPTAILLPMLVFGMALLATALLLRSSPAAASTPRDAEVAAIVAAVERVSGGEFHVPVGLWAQSAEAQRIGTALDAMAQQVHARCDGLQHAAQNDPLTGLTHRAHFQRMVDRDLDQRSHSGMVLIDIDGFKVVNDKLGHAVGDRLLQCIADRLRIATRLDNSATTIADVRVARLGGDQFGIFLAGLDSAGPARKIAHRVLRVMAEPFEMGSHVAGVSASVGLAFVPEDAANYAELLRAADAALDHAKRAGGNRVEEYTPQLDADLHERVALERDLREALVRGEFELHYQPQYDCRTLRIGSAEALIRWRHPHRGLVSPNDFIPLAEKSNLICDIGEWVVREAAVAIARFERLGTPVRISVNVSPQQLEQLEFVSVVKAALARYGAAPRLLEIEITESVAMRDCVMAAERLRRLADLGVSIAIDDFGTGFSNLASLVQLPISRLKIDRSLLADLTSRAEVRTLAQTIISMANGLGFHSVAEGVEDAAQLALLCDMGCDVVQGFHLSRPLVIEALEHLLGEAAYRDALYPKLATIAC